MSGPTTQNPFINPNQSRSSHGHLIRTPSTLEPEEFNNYIQQEYGAMWGTLKFEDSLSDYSNEVIQITSSI